MQRIRYTEEFKAEAIKQITERGHGVVEVSKRLGISDKSLYAWLRKNKATTSPDAKDLLAIKQEIKRVKAELISAQLGDTSGSSVDGLVAVLMISIKVNNNAE
jgi:transposase